MKTILVTGAAGFIGYHLTRKLLTKGETVVGLDNVNDYYAVSLKEARLARLTGTSGFTFVRGGLEDRSLMDRLFSEHNFDLVINLAAQAGVRYSLVNPHAYLDSNLTGFVNILEGCRHYGVKHLVYASSSSVYGANRAMPFSVHQNVDHPLSLYAATKKANELMAHTYSSLYGLPTTGLRLFTVYGPWGRPDMAPFLFASAILEGRPIDVYNHGMMKRDFTYIDDITDGIIRVTRKLPAPDSCWNSSNPDPGSSFAPWKIYNIGNNKPVELLYFIELLEKHLGKKAIKNLLPLQPGDVPDTFADIEDLMRDVGFRPETSIEEGVARFAEWYQEYYQT